MITSVPSSNGSYTRTGVSHRDPPKPAAFPTSSSQPRVVVTVDMLDTGWTTPRS